MNSKGHNFQNLLYDILGDLNSYSNISREDIFNKCVSKKLEAINHNYNKRLDNIYKYILTRSNIKIIKAVNKIKKG